MKARTINQPFKNMLECLINFLTEGSAPNVLVRDNVISTPIFDCNFKQIMEKKERIPWLLNRLATNSKGDNDDLYDFYSGSP